MADEIVTRQKLVDAGLDADSLQLFISGSDIEDVLTRLGQQYPTLAKLIRMLMETGGWKAYDTEDILLATVPTVSPSVGYAFDTKKLYSWNGTAWTDEGLSPLDLSKSYTDEQFNLAVQKAVFETLSQLFGLAKSDDENIKSLFTDGVGKVVIGYDLEKDTGIYAGMLEQVVEIVPGLKIYNDGRYLGLLGDSERGILIGYDMLNDLPIIAGLEELINGSGGSNNKPEVKAYNHMLWYGESFSVGQKGMPQISNSQPYANLTFDSTVRMIDGNATSTKPLIEDAGTNNPPIQTTQGETPCSGSANYASRALLLNHGILPEQHVIFASTAGHGSYRIDQLEKSSDWYPRLLLHVSRAMEVCGSDYKVQVVNFVQGANDAASGTNTPKAVYKPKLKQLQVDANTDIKSLTGQRDDIKFVIAQMSYGARTWPDQALAHLELVQEESGFCLATPMYHFPYDVDDVHLNNIGYKWMSAYFGRAYEQLIIENRDPDFIKPKVAQLVVDEIHISFDVPKAPLVIDTTTLAATTDSGFKVLVDGLSATILSITPQEDKVILKLSEPPTGAVKVRYALDYLGAGLSITGGASGNLRDSTPEQVEILGSLKPLYHLCPHFELTAFIDKGI